MDDLIRDAKFQSVNNEWYRLSLMLAWPRDPLTVRMLTWVMMNPSMATATTPDPTVKRVTSFTKAWGYDGFKIVNLWSWRTPYPTALKDAQARGVDIIGPKNDEHIYDAMDTSSGVVFAWGAGVTTIQGWENRVLAVQNMSHKAGHQPHVLRMSKTGQPCHPVRLPSNLPMTPLPYNIVSPILR